MTKNLFTEIKVGYEHLTKSEKKIADLLLCDPQAFITYSTAELAERAEVSQGSVNNFSKKFGFSGFSQLKLKAASCISSREDTPFNAVDRSKSIKNALEFKIKETTASFTNTLEINSEEALQSAVNKILGAKKIELYGVFHSGLAAKDFCIELIRLGIPATYVEDTLLCAVSASMLDENCLVIAVSSSGRTKEIIDAVDIAKKNNVPIISITSNKFSPLAQMSDDALLTASSGLSISDLSNEVHMSQLYIIYAICSYLRSVTDADGNKLYYKLQKIINSHSITD